MSDRRTRRGFHMRRVQVTLSAAKLGARVGAVHEKAGPGGICLCINRREINELGDWRGKTLVKVREIILIWARCRRQNLIRADHLRRATGLSMFGVVGLPGLAPLQAPQSARREDEGEDPGHAERVKRPDEQEGRAGLGDLAAKNASRSHHVDDGHARRKERPDEHDDVPRPRSASTNVPYNQTTRMGTTTRVEPPASAVPTLAWTV